MAHHCHSFPRMSGQASLFFSFNRRSINSKGIKRLRPFEEKDLSIHSGIYTFTQQIIKRCYRAGGLLVRICVHLNREGHATFSSPIKVHHVWQSSLYGQKDMACFTTADKGITPTNNKNILSARYQRYFLLDCALEPLSTWRRGINLVPSTAVSAVLESDIWAPGILHILRPGYCSSTSGYLLIIDRRTDALQNTRHRARPAVKSRLIFLAKQFAALAPICGGRGGALGSRLLAFLRAYGPSNWYPPPQNGRNNFQYLCLIQSPLTRRRLSSETYFDFLSRVPLGRIIEGGGWL